MAAMWRRKEDHVSGNFLCRYVQNYLLLPVIFIETRKIQLFLSSESIRGKESDLVEPDNSLLSGFLRQWHDLAARALKILLKIVWPLALQSVKRLIDHLKWKKNIYVNSALNIIVSLHLSAPAAEEAKLKTVVPRSGFYKIWELQGAIFALRISHTYFPYVFPIARGSHFQKLTNEVQAHPNVYQSHPWKFPKVPNVSKSHHVRRLEKKLIESNTRLLRNEKYIFFPRCHW